MKNKYPFYLITFIYLFGWSIGYSQDIEIRLSFKVVLNPDNGQRPNFISNNTIETAINEVNQIMDGSWRGYRFTIEDIVDVGWQGGYNEGPSKWCFTDFFAANGSQLKDVMENEAMNGVDYNWDNAAINIYITMGGGSFSGGICSFPSGNDEILIITANAASIGPLILHELGHYFGLCHTHGCFNACGTGSCDCASCSDCDSPGSDNIDDTIEDSPCWDQDQIAHNHFGEGFSGQQEVLDVFYNIMSYHPIDDTDRLTEGQLDVWADVMDFYTSRINIRSGDSWFVNPNGGNGNGTANTPFNSIGNGVDSADDNGGDIIYFRAGNHTIPTNNYTIDKPVTLRATRQGSAVIGN